MKNRFLLGCVSLLSLVLPSCNNNGPTSYTYDRSYFNGICALTGEFNNGVDVGLTNDWTASKVKAIGAKSFRLWIGLSGLFSVGEEDDLHVNQKYYLTMKDHIDKLKEAGVKNFLILYSSYVYPTGYVPTTGYVVPNPKEEYEEYIRFLNLQKEASKQIKIMFPEIRNFEPGNEPDFAVPGCIHKNGFIFNGSKKENEPYAYNIDDKTSIVMDLCWYVRQGIKEVDPDARVAIPGLTYGVDVKTTDFLDLLYKKVESRTLPAGQDFSDINPDNYFDIINYHPYAVQTTVTGDIDWDKWLEYNKSVYQVVKDHNDNGKEVYLSEIGWTDNGTTNEEIKVEIANNYKIAYNLIKNELPWITAIFAFRLTNLKTQVESIAEKNFGIFYHPDDEVHKGSPKPAAIEIAKLYNGENYDLLEHLQ